MFCREGKRATVHPPPFFCDRSGRPARCRLRRSRKAPDGGGRRPRFCAEPVPGGREKEAGRREGLRAEGTQQKKPLFAEAAEERGRRGAWQTPCRAIHDAGSRSAPWRGAFGRDSLKAKDGKGRPLPGRDAPPEEKRACGSVFRTEKRMEAGGSGRFRTGPDAEPSARRRQKNSRIMKA